MLSDPQVPATFPCDLCSAPVPDVGYVGPESCPGCPARYEYEEGRRLIPESVRAVVAAVAAAERRACAKIVMDGGDGVDRLEIAIALGPNAAIAAAILARGEPRPA